MKNKRVVIVCLFFAIVAAYFLLIADFPSASNPEYDGHTMRYWIKQTNYVPLIDLNMHGEGGWGVREHAFDALAKIGAPAVPALIQILQNKELKQDRRWKCAESLGDIGPPAKAAGNALASTLFDPTFPEAQRYELVMSLEKIGACSDQAANLIEFLKQRRQALPVAKSLLYGMDQLKTINALAKAGESAKPAVPMLADMFRDYQHAAKTLDSDASLKKDSERHSAEEDLATLRAAMIETLGALASIDPLAAVTIHSAADDPSEKVRIEAAQAFIHMGKPAPAIAILTILTGAKEPFMRWQVVDTLALLGEKQPKAAEPLLRKLLHDDNDEARWRSAEALGDLGPAAADALPELKQCLNDKNEHVREEAHSAIERISAKK